MIHDGSFEAPVKSERTIQREVKALRAIEADMENSEGMRVQAGAMVLALEWALQRWGMKWSAWLIACRKSAETKRHL